MPGRWFRFYVEAAHDPKLLALSPEDRWMWITLMCLSAETDGRLPANESIALSRRREVHAVVTVVERLSNGGLIDRANGGPNGWHYAIHGWSKRQYKSDTSTARVKRFRNGDGNVSETPRARAHSVSVSGSSSSPLSGSLFLGEENQEEEKTLEAPASRARPRFGEWPSEKEARDAFAKWWPMYYKRGGATEAFEKFAIHVSPAEFDDLVQATIAHAAFRAKDVKPDDPDGRKFTQGAKTWLLNRRWRDWLKVDEVSAQMATAAPVLTPSQQARAEAQRKLALVEAEIERRKVEKAGAQGRLLT